MFRRTPPRPLRPTVGNTLGLTTRFSGSCLMKVTCIILKVTCTEPVTFVICPHLIPAWMVHIQGVVWRGARPPLILYEKGIRLRIPRKEVYYTNSLILHVEKML